MASAVCLGTVLAILPSCSSDRRDVNLHKGEPGGGESGGSTASGGEVTGRAGAGARSGGAGSGMGGLIGGAGMPSEGGTGGLSAGGSSGTTGAGGGVVGSGGSGGSEGGTGGIVGAGGSSNGGATGGGTGGTDDGGGGASGSGGETGGASGTGATAGAGGATGGVAGTGGAGGCSREPDQDEVCREQGYPPVAYFCQDPAPWPSTACVDYLPIGSGDGLCCPDEYVSCPQDPPADGSACAEDMDCSWGSHPEPACRTDARCASGTWSVSEPPAYCSDPQLPPECPTAPDDLALGATCSPGGLICDYPTGDRCTCSDCTAEDPVCGPAGDYTWTCWAPPEGCPTYFPNLGSVCTLPENTDCRYTCADIARCSAEGIWVAGPFDCPDCNAPNTPIAAPDGSRPVAALRPGDLVYSVHRGELAIVPVLEVRSKPQRNHHVMRVVLATGTTLEISASHPTADGRTLGDLTAGDELDGVRVVAAELVPYEYSHTYDILPASDTGTYYAGGVLIGSTLRAPTRIEAPAPLSQ